MDASVIRQHGRRVGTGRYSGTVWEYDGRQWMIFGRDTFAYLWGRAGDPVYNRT